LAADMLASQSRTLKTQMIASIPKKLEPKKWLIGLALSRGAFRGSVWLSWQAPLCCKY